MNWTVYSSWAVHFFFRTNKNIKIFLIFKIKYPSPIPHDVYVRVDFSQIDYLKNFGNCKTITDSKLSLNTILHDKTTVEFSEGDFGDDDHSSDVDYEPSFNLSIR